MAFLILQGSECDQKPALNRTLLVFRSYLHKGIEVEAGYKGCEVRDFPLPPGLFLVDVPTFGICLCPLSAGWMDGSA